MADAPLKTTDDALAGAAIYNPFSLNFYDVVVLGISNPLAWGCPTRFMLDLYNQNVTANHLDVGVGTGYYLDKCTFRKYPPRIALLDLSANSLAKTAQRLKRYQPQTYQYDILQPIPLTEQYDSIGLTYVLHCLPGTLATKSLVFENLKPLLKSGGIIFGTTILGKGVQHNWLGKRLMAVYNRKKVFSNLEDDRETLEKILKTYFDDVTLEIKGRVAIFTAHKK